MVPTKKVVSVGFKAIEVKQASNTKDNNRVPLDRSCTWKKHVKMRLREMLLIKIMVRTLGYISLKRQIQSIQVRHDHKTSAVHKNVHMVISSI